MDEILTLLKELEAKVLGVFIPGLLEIGLGIPKDEVAAFSATVATLKADLAAGKGYGEAMADAWTTFYNAEKSEFTNVLADLLSLIENSLKAAG